MQQLKASKMPIKKTVEVVKVPEPGPDPIMHSDIQSIFEVIDAIKPEERPTALDSILDLTYSKNLGYYLVDKIASTQQLID